MARRTAKVVFEQFRMHEAFVSKITWNKWRTP